MRDLDEETELNRYLNPSSLISGLNDRLMDCMELLEYDMALAMGMNVI